MNLGVIGAILSTATIASAGYVSEEEENGVDLNTGLPFFVGETDQPAELNERSHNMNMKGSLRKNFGLEAVIHSSFENNIICSPVSALWAVATLAKGASRSTRYELFKVLGIENQTELRDTMKTIRREVKKINGMDLLVGVKILTDASAPYKDEFLGLLERTDFNRPKDVAMYLNNWVDNRTDHHVPQYIHPKQIENGFSIYIGSVVHIPGFWNSDFKRTNDAFFTMAGPVDTPAISSTVLGISIDEPYLQAQVIEIFDLGDDSSLSLIIVMPVYNDGLYGVLKKLHDDPTLLNTVLEPLKSKLIHVTIPRCIVQSTNDLKKLYKKVGVRRMFGAEMSELDHIADQRLHVNRADQIIVVEFTENRSHKQAVLNSDDVEILQNYEANARKYRPVEEFFINKPFYFILKSSTEQIVSGIFVSPGSCSTW